MTEPTVRKPLRLWPGVVAAMLLVLAWLVVPIIAPDAAIFGVIGAVGCGLAIFVWWLFFSRAPWSERVGAIVLTIVAVFATRRLVHPSIANGMMGMMLPMFSIPVTGFALLVWAAASRRFPTVVRRTSMIAAILLACGGFTLVRTGGITGDGKSDLHWRWTPTPEERLLAEVRDTPRDPARDGPAAPPAAPNAAETPDKPLPGGASDNPADPTSAPAAAEALKKRAPVGAGEEPLDSARGKPAVRAAEPAAVETKTAAEWPGFRGRARDGVVRGVRIATDWVASPPVQLWRRPVGPGWSSFAVHGDLLYTQEQRGGDEIVACYKMSTGEPAWRHRDAVRFWESNGGAGPRATPTLSGGRVYTMGATGIVNALDAENGAVVWSRNAATDTSRTVPDWGIASSPLVIDDLVVVAVAGRLVAYDVRTGRPRWFGGPEGGGYSSPHLMTIDGTAQIVLLRGRRTTSVAPADGTVLWEHLGQPAVSIVQPALAADHDVLIAAGDAMGGMGIRRVAIAHGSGGWTVEERWTSRGLKPYFNDFVVHKGHAYGFDGNILACIDLEDGTRKWKGGRYGNGQLVLLPDQDLLLVLSEDGELALVKATPDQFTELARFTALDGKTWNHPVLVGDVLLVRNDHEMVAFRLSLASPRTDTVGQRIDPR